MISNLVGVARELRPSCRKEAATATTRPRSATATLMIARVLRFRAMKRRTLAIISVAVALLGLVVAVAASFLHDGLSSRATPTRLEIMVARNARHLAIPSNARLAQNPLLVSTEDLRDARLHFADHCAVCHANDGGGQTMIGGGLYPKPADLRLPAPVVGMA